MNFETWWNTLTAYQQSLAMSSLPALKQLAKKARDEGHEEGYEKGYDTGYGDAEWDT
jgi:flagellar biosynthesis/type III secretory pathway protein FliH